ncbi:SLAM family member 9-like isoform X2 [Scleropages formosus]|nr:SLAM family member 9-like isoform X2 [Scleropages formosus]
MTRNDFFTMQWYFNDRNIVKNTGGKDDVNLHSQFRERLQLSSDFSLTITGLILQDSGVYQRSVLRKDRVKIPVHTVHLQLYESVKAVKIQLNTTWLPVKQTCEVHVMCSSSGDQSASYTWRKGNQTVRGRELHFSLSPAEGGVTLTCTVHNGVSEKSTNDTVRCTSAAPPPALSLCLMKAVLFSVGLVIMVSAVLTIHLRERLCREGEKERRTKRQSRREQRQEMK